MYRALLAVCAALFLVPSLLAGECDFVYPSYFDAGYTCDSSAEAGCALSQAVTFRLTSWASGPTSCATVEWDFGDGTTMVTNGAQLIPHTYAQAGTYHVTAAIATAATIFKSTDSFDVVVSNGAIRIGTAEINEGAVASIRMTRTNVTGAVDVPWSILRGGVVPTDVTPTSGVASFAPGQATAIVQIQSINDSSYISASARRTYDIVPGKPTGGFLATKSTLTINDDDYPLIAIDPKITVYENAGYVSVPVRRVGGDPTAPFSVAFSYWGSSAAVATSGLLNFAPGEMSRSFNVVLIDNAVRSGVMLDTIAIGGNAGGVRFAPSSPSHVVLEILDDDPVPVVTASNVSVTEGDAGTKNVSVQLTSSAPINNGGSIAYVISSQGAKRGSDYQTTFTAGSVSISTSAKIDFTIIGDTDVELDEVITLTLSRNFGDFTLVPFATVTILNDDAGLGPDNLQIPLGDSATAVLNIGMVTSSPLVVPLSTTRPDLVQIPASITVPAGQSRVSFSVKGIAVDGALRISADLPAERGGTKTIVASVYQPLQLAFDPRVANIVAGQELPVRITLTPDQATRELALHVANPGVATAPASLTVTGGSGTFTLRGIKSGTTILTIINPDGSEAEQVLEVNVVAAADVATLAAISPATGPAAGGTSFVASGTRLTADCTLSFGGVPLTETTLRPDGTLAGITPPHAAGTVDVALTCGSDRFTLPRAFTYLTAPPTLASIAPSFGSTSGGTLVRATGTNFQSGCWMFFAEVPANGVNVDSTTSLTAVAPPRTTVGTIPATVRCGNASSSPAWFAYSGAAEPSSSIISIDPLVGAPGDSVTITGSRFRADDRFRFDDVDATILRTRSDEHVIRIPELPLGMSSITMTDVAGRTTTTGPIFLIVEPAPPRVTSVEPANALAGSEVELLGSGFRPAYSFAIGGRAATVISLTSTRAIVRIASEVAAGIHPVHVLNGAGRIATIGAAAIVGSGALRVRDALPPCGTTDGGTVVTIIGSDFAEGASVTFNGVAATSVERIDAHTLRATTPAGATGNASIAVTNPNGDLAAISDVFRYVSPFDPNSGCGGNKQRGVRH